MVILMLVMLVYKLAGIGCPPGKAFTNEILYYTDGEAFCLHGSSTRFASKANKLNARNKRVIPKEILMATCVVCNALMKKEEKTCKCHANPNNLAMSLDKLKV